MHSLLRFFYILRIVIAYRIDRIGLPWYRCFSFWFAFCAPLAQFKYGYQPRAKRLVDAAVAMGPIFVKFAQIISARIDLLPDDILQGLASLQDQVPACTKNQVQSVLQSVQGDFSKVFDTFDWNPLGSASIAQVHGATLHSGHHVAVKILRPRIRQSIARDIQLLKFIAFFINALHPNSEYLRVYDVIEEFEHTCTFECDLLNEAGNYHYMRHLARNESRMFVPKVYWEYSNTDVLVIERVHGIPISNDEDLHKHRVNMSVLATTIVELFFKQVFEYNFFHADMHPGNLFVMTADGDNPRWAAVDYGITGSLSPKDQQYLAENIYAFTQRDYAKVVDLHISSGWVVATTNRQHMISKIRAIGESVFDRPLECINCAKLLLQVLLVARQHGMIVQPQLLLLQKTLMHVEALARRIYPKLNMWHIVSPYIERWVLQKYSVASSCQKLITSLPSLLDSISHKPNITDTYNSYRTTYQLNPYIFVLGFISAFFLMYINNL